MGIEPGVQALFDDGEWPRPLTPHRVPLYNDAGSMCQR